MVRQIKNISVRQALIAFVLLLGSPSIRVLPAYSVEKAKQAAWLTPIIAIIITLIFLILMQKIFSKYDKESFVAIMEDVFGIFLGKTLGILLFLYITFLSSFYIRFFAERLTASLSIHTSYIVYVGVMLVFISYVIKYDLPVLARMNEILLWIVVVVYLTICILTLQNIKISNFYPISYMDIVPVLEGSIPVVAIWSYISIVFMFSDRISNKKNLFKVGLKNIGLLSILTILAISIPLGVFGNSAKSLSYPFGATVQTISYFHAIERVEALVIAIWIITDFCLISVFIVSALHTLKSVLRTTDSKPLTNIYILMLFFLSIYIADNVIELRALSSKLLIYSNGVIGFGIPFLLFVVAKIRKKV
jgi:spore germination protein KB